MKYHFFILALTSIWTIAYSSPMDRYVTLGDYSERSHTNYRLPNNSVPISYLIKIIPYLVVDNFTFDGESSIVIQVLEPTYHLTLHTYNLTYDEDRMSLESQDGVGYNVTKYEIDQPRDFLKIEFDTELPTGNYTLNLTYQGVLNNELSGFYRSSYMNDAGEEVWLAVTKFEPVWARWAFPCYDEPALKATFDIWIKHEAEYGALSNMPIISNETDPVDGKIWTIFETTPLISSYLVAYMVSDFESIPNDDGTLNIWCRPNAIAKSHYALQRGLIKLKALEEYTGIPYALPKIDHVSIPDFPSGAMENWGLITYKEGAIYFEEGVTDVVKRQYIDSVIAHEIAHQWFGNLVGPKWWQYTWLNEGFATYFQHYLNIDDVNNRQKMHQFIVERQQGISFLVDAYTDTQALNNYVEAPTDIRGKFTDTTYSKGCSVIRMMANFLSESTFKAGLRKYLARHAYSSATSDDLFSAMQSALGERQLSSGSISSIDVKTVMNNWIEQPGFPLVTVTRNYTTGTTKIGQERYVVRDFYPGEYEKFQWWVPVSWATESDPNFDRTVPQKWIPDDQSSIVVDTLNTSEWIIINIQQIGYYRVNYDDTNWNRIAAYLNSEDYETVHVLNRAQLLDDAFTLAGSGELPYSVVLNLASYLHREVDCLPWYSALTGFNTLSNLLENTPSYKFFKEYAQNLMRNVFEAVGVDGSEADDSFTYRERERFVNVACSIELESCSEATHAKLLSWLHEAESRGLVSLETTAEHVTFNFFEVLLRNHYSSPHEITTAIHCSGLRNANATTWNRVWNFYPQLESEADKFTMLIVLGCSDDVDIISNWMRIILDSMSTISKRFAAFAFEQIYSAKLYNVDIAFDFVVENFDEFNTRFGRETVISLLFDICSQMTNEEQVNKLKRFIGKKNPGSQFSMEKLLKGTESIVARSQRVEPEMRKWFVEHFSKNVSENIIGEPSSIDETIPRASISVTSDPLTTSIPRRTESNEIKN